MDPRTIHQSTTGNSDPRESSLRRVLGSCFIAGLCFALFLLAPSLLAAQEPPTEPTQEPAQSQPPPANAQPSLLVTVHGQVHNAATGQPLPRALVRIEGDAETGTLTDGDGRFEIPGVPVGPQAFLVVKPGFRDRPYAAGSAALEDTIGPTHSVLVAEGMPELDFALAPTCSIHGQIDLSTGDPAQGIGVELLRQMLQDGRAVWLVASGTRTNSEGAYRFAGLPDGVYAIHTQPAMDSESATIPFEADKVRDVARAGYASTFYPGVRDLAGAAKISLANGEQALANFTLAIQPFQAVTATAAIPRGGPPSGVEAGPAPMGSNYTATVLDSAGHQLAYPTLYDQATRTIQALLPDGAYTLFIRSQQQFANNDLHGTNEIVNPNLNSGVLTGSVDFSVAGHAVFNLRVPISTPPANSVQLTVLRSATGSAPSLARFAEVLASQTGGSISDGMTTVYAQDLRPGANPATNPPPGAYWVRTVLAGNGFCEQSFTAGGASLAREPLVLSPSGSAPPIELTLRDDCANLTLSLPQALAGLVLGEERFYTVYAIPDFETTVEPFPVTLRPSTGGTFTLNGLTPGAYHVYTFPAPVRLEYRNPAALAALPNPGQPVTLSPGTTTNLVLEAPEH